MRAVIIWVLRLYLRRKPEWGWRVHPKMLTAAQLHALEVECEIVPPGPEDPSYIETHPYDALDPQSQGWTVQRSRNDGGFIEYKTPKRRPIEQDPIVAQFLTERIDLPKHPPLTPAMPDVWSHMTAQEEQFAIQEGNW